jgi:hypothetical protein
MSADAADPFIGGSVLFMDGEVGWAKGGLLAMGARDEKGGVRGGGCCC